MSENRSDHYQQLIRNFLQSGELINLSGSDDPDPLDEQRPPPSDEKINSILKPWRSENLRKIGAAIKKDRTDEVIILRTYYGSKASGDQFLETIVREDADFDCNHEQGFQWWRVLDDQDHFDFGFQWEKVLEVLPELTMRGAGKKSTLSPASFDDIVQYVDEYGYDLEQSVQHSISLSAHPILVLDQDSLTTKRVKLMFPDPNGNVIRSTELSMPEDIYLLGEYRMCAFRTSVDNMSTWQDAMVSQQYQADGAIGRVLYSKVDEARQKQQLSTDLASSI